MVDILRNLGILIKKASSRYSNEFIWQDVSLTDEFKRFYIDYLHTKRYDIEFFDSTAVITTPESRLIFVPNQWFVIASYVVDIYEELYKYKGLIVEIAQLRGKRLDEYAKELRDATSFDERCKFFSEAIRLLKSKNIDEKAVEVTTEKLWRFVTDYSWWSGQKTVDRHDFHVSVILNMLNLVNASQGYVADIVSAYVNDGRLRNLVKSTDGFTINLSLPEGYVKEYFQDEYSESLSLQEVPETHLGKTLDNDSSFLDNKPHLKISKGKVKEIKYKPL